MTMTREKQLELVARSTVRWPRSKIELLAYWNGKVFFANKKQIDRYIEKSIFMEYFFFTCSEVEAKQREITGEPDDKNAPDLANWKAQDKNGTWVWYEDKPSIAKPHSKQWFLLGWHRMASKGEVIGDWRDTLKKIKREEKEMENVEFVHGNEYHCDSYGKSKFVGVHPNNGEYGIFVSRDHGVFCSLLSQAKPSPSERDEFAESVREVFYDAYHSDGELPSIALADDDAEAYGKAIFDAIAEGRLKAPEVKK